MPARGNVRYINRELSWLEFNQRVLDEALDPSVPLLDRLFFLGITASNLDEFFMVRVGGLQILKQRGITGRDPSGMTPGEQLKAVDSRVRKMIEEQYRAFTSLVEQELPAKGVIRRDPAELDSAEVAYIQQYFEREIFPVITPGAVGELFPLLPGLRINIAVRLKGHAGDKEPRLAILPLNDNVERFIFLPGKSGYEYVLLEDLLCFFAGHFFPGEHVAESAVFRITRNADMSVEEEWARDLAKEMEEVLHARKDSACVRLEISETASTLLRTHLCRRLEISKAMLYACAGPVGLSAFHRLCFLNDLSALRYERWPPRANASIDLSSPLFEQISRNDILLFHPYESFEPVVRLLEDAAEDPDVLAIKQILYRTSSDSQIVAALRKAASNGKSVTVLVELKARFDEARNIEWARSLEQDGIQVIYGVKGFKTHAKICLVVRREKSGLARYCHFSTGNYNEKTARLYTDIGLLTRDEELCRDASAFFNSICGYSEPQLFSTIAAAPIGIRNALLTLIENEAERSRQGQAAFIHAKMNALVDPEIIKALYRASRDGVQIKLCVRGACCLRPGVKNLSENITVISIIDRLLEHSRIIHFHQGGENRLFISSADWMPRNFDRRIELLVPVRNAAVRKKLITILNTSLKDTAKARRILANGSYERVMPSGRARPVRSQEVFYRTACSNDELTARRRSTAFEPHRPPDTPPAPGSSPRR